MIMKTLRWILVVLSIVICFSVVIYTQNGFTQKDRELLIELRVRMTEIDKRFEQIEKRFEQIDKRFEQVDKRFEQVDKRFSDLFTFLWILAGIFTTLTISVIGFAYWDRRTIIREAKERTIQEIEKEGKLRDVINALREFAKTNPEMQKILKQFHL